ncbi:MAG: hypothetical protein CMM94_04765 [Rickettsiales bacterium]|nr:hypothetical protein [Rickettsiales bacterium]
MAKYFIPLLTAAILLAACSDMPSLWEGSEPEEPKLPGERIAIMPKENAVEADASLEGKKAYVPDFSVNKAWPQHGGRAESHRGNFALRSTEVGARVTIGDGNGWETRLVPSPVVAAGRVFAMDARGYVSAHKAGDISTVLWTSDVAVELDEPELLGGGLAYDNGQLFIATGYGKVYALAANDGSLRWQRAINIPLRAAPRVAENKVFIISVDNQAFALDTLTGAEVWSDRGINEKAGFVGSVVPGYGDGKIVMAYSSGEVRALNAVNGAELWSDMLILPRRTSAIAALSGIDAGPLVLNGIVFAVSNTGLMVANDGITGRSMWQQQIASHYTPWALGDSLYMLTTDNQLVALQMEDGRVRWVSDLFAPLDEDEQEILRVAPPVAAGNNLLVSTNIGRMLVVSPQDGSVNTEFTIPEDIVTTPVIANGVMYLLDTDATLYALQ